MKSIFVIQFWILFHSAIVKQSKCKELLLSENGLSNTHAYEKLHCRYDLNTGDQICDCLNRNQVNQKIEQKISKRCIVIHYN